KIRFELIDLARHHQGPRGHGRHHQTVTSSAGFSEEFFHKGMENHPQPSLSPSQQAEGQDLHQLIEQLPDALKEVFDLHYYHDLPQAEIAQLLGVDVRTVKRKWRAARLALQSKWQLWQAENQESFK
ncbi:MAG: RNA polymerase sigma factor, partial [Verrucomicrobiales bacterium]